MRLRFGQVTVPGCRDIPIKGHVAGRDQDQYQWEYCSLRIGRDSRARQELERVGASDREMTGLQTTFGT